MAIDYSQPVDVVDNITKEEFEKNYRKPEKPVVMRSLWDNYPASEKWTMEYFKSKLGDIEVGLFDNNKQKPDRSFKTPHTKMKFGDYLDLISREPTNLRIFLFDIFKHKPDLIKDFGFPPITSSYLKKFPFMFFGGANSVVRMHEDMDMSNVFLTQLHGKKKVILFSPEYSDLLYRYPYNVHSSVDIENPDYEKYPGLAYVKGSHCVLNHGDTLFIPSGYWHHITYLEGGYAISLRAFSAHYAKRLSGFWKVAVLSNVDDLMRKMVGKRWFEHKTKVAHQRAENAIKKIEGGTQQELSVT
ncbi:MAG TPA: cupin-like domain-containing protein [Bacteroidales bacterium]|nr:cupin-like domain-containing protein [Bacteroidales bacterium]